MKTGIVMEGGGMRGMFTAGVIDVFLENSIKFDGAVGVSAGATFGCNLKSKQAGRAIRYNKKYGRDWRYCSLRSLFLTGNLFGADFCYKKLPEELDPFDWETFASNPLEFYCVVSDCQTGNPVFKKLETCCGAEMDYMRASASLPLVSHAVKIDGKEYLDGGMTDSIPLKAFENLGFAKNVVVLTQPEEFTKKPGGFKFLIKLALRKYPLLMEAWFNRHNVYNEEREYVFKRREEGNAFVIAPEKPLEIGRTDLNPEALQRVYDEGRRTALKNLDKIKAFLG